MRLLAAKTPASFIAFDLLALGDDDYSRRPFSERRGSARGGARPAAPAGPPHAGDRRTRRSPREWFSQFEGAGLDGSIAKPLAITYQPDKRVMFKIKHERTADCVVAGYRPHKTGGARSARCCSGCTRRRASWPASGVIGAFPMAERRRCSPSCSPL